MFLEQAHLQALDANGKIQVSQLGAEEYMYRSM